jgi:Fic family protein
MSPIRPPVERGLLPPPLLYLSAYVEATRQEHYRLLSSVAREGAWEEWLIYFLAGVSRQSEDVFCARRILEVLEEPASLSAQR